MAVRSDGRRDLRADASFRWKGALVCHLEMDGLRRTLAACTVVLGRFGVRRLADRDSPTATPRPNVPHR